MTLIEQLNWRYSAKKMNGTKVPKEKIDNILEAIRLAPTSYGMQEFKVFVIESKDLLQKIYDQSCHQTQVLECSHLLVFAATKKIKVENVNNYIQAVAKNRNLELSTLDGFKTMLNNLVEATEEKNFAWTSRQTYIALSYASIAAANEQVDSTPIEGFNPKILDEILDLQSMNLGSVCLLTLGYRDEENDKYLKFPKLRKNAKDIFIYY
jgi:nitroreductase